MIDLEKVVCAIENCIGLPKCKDCPWEDCEVEHEVVDSVPYGLLRDALALLKEQEPKPIAYTDNPYTGLPVACCPKCGKFARQFPSAITEETHYCPWCGQAVLWHNE